MIIRDKPGPLELLFAVRGSVLPRIATELAIIMGVAVLVVLWDQYVSRLTHLSSTPFALFGVALSLFLGFRNNAAYERWWEARKLLGGLLADSRAIAREAEVFFHDTPARHRLLRQVIAFHHLHRCVLRGIEPDMQAERLARDCGIEVLTPYAALDAINHTISAGYRSGTIDGFGARTLSERMAAFAHGLTGCERIRTTPLPYAYSMLIYRTTWAYCLLLPLALLDGTGWMTPLFCGLVGYTFLGLAEVSEELVYPYGQTENSLPLDAICRNVEISLAPHLNEPPPPPLTPVNFRLD